ncbi:hypothetical protein ACL02T_12150 [Pseudonocardia sp. RS010]|uniref:hypothetical protein n=1 Tax=Pseudonocardia sp. RS010 TaxID=3385979 RepID=UPI0039A055A8
MSEQPVPAPDSTGSAVLASPAWVIGGLRNRPGYLVAAEKRVAFTDGEETLFDVPLAEISGVTYPWYWFGGGLKARIAGKTVKITFVKPNGMPSPDPSALELGLSALGVAAAFQGVGHVGDLAGPAWIAAGRKATAQWREVLPT